MNNIYPHTLTRDPTRAWDEICQQQTVARVNLPQLPTEIPSNRIRVVCMSDTHSLTSKIEFPIPNGDIFIHAGDFTNTGRITEIVEFNNWIGTLPHKHKIVIAGNHELCLDENCTHPLSNLTSEGLDYPFEFKNIRDLLYNCSYIQDQLIEIWGLKIYGSPWQPEFGNWAFNLPRGEHCLSKWNQIPEGVDLLITHGPPVGHGDLCRSGLRAGCVDLLTTIQKRVKPKYHIFGHIHEGYGVTTDGSVTYVNASTCNFNYAPINLPIVFEIDLPDGSRKE